MSAVGCFGRFTFSHLAFHIPTLAGSCLCLFCVVVCLVALFLCFWFLFCKCLGIPNSPRSLDLDDRQGLIARSAMQQKKKGNRDPGACAGEHTGTICGRTRSKKCSNLGKGSTHTVIKREALLATLAKCCTNVIITRVGSFVLPCIRLKVFRHKAGCVWM